jgi:1,4-dihydroxy-2-naphthoyl-CoA hydrolase
MPDLSATDLSGTSMPLHDLLGIAFTEMSADRVVLAWTVDERHLQPFGLGHGGVYCLVHESAASVAGGLWFGEDGQVVGVNNNTDFLRASRVGDHLQATATPVHRGRSQQLWLIETRDQEDRLVARGHVRLQNLPRRR